MSVPPPAYPLNFYCYETLSLRDVELGPPGGGHTEITAAAWVGNYDRVRELLLTGAGHVTEEHAVTGDTALHCAATESTDIVLLLLQHGANPERRNRSNYLPHEVAANYDEPDAEAILRFYHKSNLLAAFVLFLDVRVIILMLRLGHLSSAAVPEARKQLHAIANGGKADCPLSVQEAINTLKEGGDGIDGFSEQDRAVAERVLAGMGFGPLNHHAARRALARRLLGPGVTPRSYCLCPRQVRATVRCVFEVAGRLDRGEGTKTLPRLPLEMWLCVVAML